MERPRLLPKRPFPAYAYLPGRQPHPVRDPAGHSYQVEPGRWFGFRIINIWPTLRDLPNGVCPEG